MRSRDFRITYVLTNHNPKVTPTVARTEPTNSDGEASRLEFEITSRSKYSPENIHKTDRTPSRYRRDCNVRIQITSPGQKSLHDLRKQQSFGAMISISQLQLGSGDKYHRALREAYFRHDYSPPIQMLFPEVDYERLSELLLVFVTNQDPKRGHRIVS